MGEFVSPMGTRMETLVIAVVALLGLVAASSGWEWATKKLESKTGKGLGDWILSSFNALLFAGIGIGGLGLVAAGVIRENVPVTFVGLVVAIFCFALAYSALRD